MKDEDLIVSRCDYYRIRCKNLEDAIDRALTHLDNEKTYEAIVVLERALEEGEITSE